MNAIKRALAASVALLLGGGAAADERPPAAVAEPPAAAIMAPAIAPVRPPSADAELLYRILVAELAMQRDQPELALEHYQVAASASRDPAISERAVGIALFLDEVEAALPLAQRWQALAPDNPRARQMLALALLRNQRLDEAVPQLDAARAAASNDGQDGFATLGNLFSQVDDKPLVLQVMTRLRALHADSVYALYYYALAAQEANQSPAALEALNTILVRDPQWGPAYLLRAQLLMDANDKDAALQGLADGVAKLPDNRNLRNGYARLLVNTKRLDEARQQFRILSEQNPKDPEALFALGLLASEAKQFDDAVGYFNRILELGVRRSETYYELGRVEELRKNYLKAKEWYARVSDEERYLSAQVKIGQMLAKAKDFPAMAAHFIKLRQDNPQQVVTLFVSEGEILREEKRYQEGFDLLSQALEQHPNDKELLYARSLLAERLDRLDLLEKDLRTLIASDPQHGQALNALGYTLADRTDRHQEALGYLQQAIALLPNDAAVVDSMGWVLYRLGQYDPALVYLRRAYGLSEDDEIASHLAEVLWVSGHQEEARELWRRALEKEPDSEFLLKLRERLGL
jgi:tetratricopeptide (TPR) repeat protein